MDSIKFYLVLEKRLGDYNIIPIEDLDIYDNTPVNTLAGIDSFTCQFTEKELRDSIEKGNLVQLSYLSGKLKVISEYKHNFEILTKETFDRINEFTNSLITDKQLLNRIYNVYKNNVESVLTDKDMIKRFLKLFKDSLYENDFRKSMELIEQLPYLKARNVYFYINKVLKEM